jgi:integrase
VFCGTLGGYLDGSALSKRFRRALQRAALRPLRFHDLRHTFGTWVIGKTDIRRVQKWMGHANVQATMQCLDYVPRPQDAQLVAEAFELHRGGPDATRWPEPSGERPENPWRLF